MMTLFVINFPFTLGQMNILAVSLVQETFRKTLHFKNKNGNYESTFSDHYRKWHDLREARFLRDTWKIEK